MSSYSLTFMIPYSSSAWRVRVSCSLGSSQRSGSGTVNYANGDQFSGSFAADLRDGSGTYTWANGTTYRGTWKAGKARKGGTYSYTDAGVKEGLSAGGNLTMQD